MQRLNHYLSTTLIQTIALVLFFLLSLSFFMQLVGEIRDVGKGDYDLFSAFRYVILMLPETLYRFFPSAGLLGSLVGLGILAHHSELLAMRAAGISIWQMSKIVLRISLLLTLLVSGIAEWLTPTTTHLAATQKTLAKSGGQALATSRGLWIREGDTFIHIQTVVDNKLLRGVTTYDFDKNFKLTEAMHAKQAVYLAHEWLLQDVARSFLSENEIKASHQLEENWRVQLDPTILKVATVQPEEMSLLKLHLYLNYMAANDLNNDYYRFIFWQRIFQPLATIVMIMLAIPFIFGPLRQVTLGLRLVCGIALGFLFYLMNTFIGPFSVVYHVPPLLANLTPTLVFAGVGVYLLRRL